MELLHKNRTSLLIIHHFLFHLISIENTKFASNFHKSMSDSIKHECGIALLRLKKPLQFYLDKYGSAFYGINKLHLLMEKQHNRGQDGAGVANIKFDMDPGDRYISRTRSIKKSPIQDIFDQINSRFKSIAEDNASNF